MFAHGVELEFAGGGDERVPVEDDYFFAGGPGGFSEALAQFQFFGGKEFVAEAADFPKGRGFTKNKGTGHQAPPAADKIPKRGDQPGEEVSLVQANGCAAREVAAGFDGGGDLDKQIRAGAGISIHEEQPVASGGFGATIAGAGDLVDGFEDDGGPGGAGDVGRFIGGIVVANDEFGRPAAAFEGGGGLADVRGDWPSRRSSLNAGTTIESFMVAMCLGLAGKANDLFKAERQHSPAVNPEDGAARGPYPLPFPVNNFKIPAWLFLNAKHCRMPFRYGLIHRRKFISLLSIAGSDSETNWHYRDFGANV